MAIGVAQHTDTGEQFTKSQAAIRCHKINVRAVRNALHLDEEVAP